MDLQTVREAAIEATTRAFWDRNGFVPNEDSEEWEEEYRRQFEQAKKRYAMSEPVTARPKVGRAPEEGPDWAVLTGAPTQIRWAATLRADRLREIKDAGTRQWLATTWGKAKSWIDTRDLPISTFLQRIEPHYAEFRRQAGERAREAEAERQQKAAVADTVRREIETAKITVEGLVELIDIAERLPRLPVKAKLAELDVGGRNLRVFETADPAVLMVLEKAEDGRSEYGIEHDDGLVADLKLFSRAAELL